MSKRKTGGMGRGIVTRSSNRQGSEMGTSAPAVRPQIKANACTGHHRKELKSKFMTIPINAEQDRTEQKPLSMKQTQGHFIRLRKNEKQ